MNHSNAYMMDRKAVVALGGGSGSGKTSIARALAARLGNALVLDMDRYYEDRAGMEMVLREQCNFDDPDAIDWPLLRQHVQQLRSGVAVQAPIYDFRSHLRRKATEELRPGAVIVLEGLHALYDPELREVSDLAVFVEADEGIRFERRMTRDTVERGRSATSVREQYQRTVQPMYERFVLPVARYADVRLDGAAPVPANVAVLLQAMRQEGLCA